MDGARDSWSFIGHFRLPAAALVDDSRSWAAITAFTSAWRALVHKDVERLRPVLQSWQDLFADLDGEPLLEDWASFRPLRRSREEDWSDWLAWLLASSQTGALGRALFGGDAADHATPAVDREVAASRDGSSWRLDLRIRWKSEEYTHVEVKVGDTQFAKTFETAHVHRHHVGASKWADWILLPESDLDEWHRVAALSRTEISPEVRTVTWRQVARALRRCLATGGGERVTWRVWARAFLGCVEQQLLHLPVVRPGAAVGDERLADVVLHLEACLDGR